MGVARFLRTKVFAPIFGASNSAAVTDFAMSEVQKAVAVLKATSIGTVVANDISALMNANMSGEQKFASVLASTTPLIVSFLSGKGVAQIALTQVEDIARELIQSMYNDTKSSTAGGLAAQVLALFGVKL